MAPPWTPWAASARLCLARQKEVAEGIDAHVKAERWRALAEQSDSPSGT
jgi:hypothetical protein